MTGKYKATSIGMIYTIFCLLSIFTFIIPLLIMIPLSLPLELIFTKIFGNEDFSKVGISVLISLIVLCLGLTVIFYNQFRRQLKENKSVSTLRFILFLTLQLIIIHPLVFYLNSSGNWSGASDGQFILGISRTFPVSSFAFVLFGIVLDLMRNGKEENETLTPE